MDDVFIYEVEQFYVPQNVLLPLGKQRYRHSPPRLLQFRFAETHIFSKDEEPEVDCSSFTNT